MILAMLFLAHLGGIVLQAQALPISPLPWFAIAMVVALLVIVVSAAIYMIAPLFGSGAMRQWSIFQIYEAVLSIALILVFLGVVSLFFLNPEPGFASAGLVPNGCTSTNTIYTLSACDLGQFNTAGYNMVEVMWGFSLLKALVPSQAFNIQPIPDEGDSVELSFTVPNTFDGWNTSLVNVAMQAILAALLLSQLQLVLLSSSLLLLSLFFTIGLIARVFGISRSFGGAMIAFGIGLGIIYPLLIAVTYGYVDVAAGTYAINQLANCVNSIATCISTTGGAPIASFAGGFYSLMISPFATLSSLGLAIASVAPTPFVGVYTTIASGAAATQIQALAGIIVYVFQEIGYIIAGLTIIPIINIIIVDVFIIDFSSAVGERMSFSMLFQGLV